MQSNRSITTHEAEGGEVGEIDIVVENKSLNQDVEERQGKYFMWLYIVGIVNNNGYTLLQAASSDLAKIYKKQNLMGLFLFLMMGFGILTRYAHGAFCVNISHVNRAAFFCVVTAVSYILLFSVLVQ